MCGTGFLLGRFVPGLIRHLPWLVAGVIAVSLLPLLAAWGRERLAEVRRRSAAPLRRRAHYRWGRILRLLGRSRARLLRERADTTRPAA